MNKHREELRELYKQSSNRQAPEKLMKHSYENCYDARRKERWL